MTDRPGVPICVDLDGTLVRGDVMLESVLKLVRLSPLYLLRMPLWLVRGRARFKRELALLTRVEPASLPYNRGLLDYLSEQRARGRTLLLVTASDELAARVVADHLGLFDQVLATDGARNLKGSAKRQTLVERFGEGGFDYAGNSAADLAVWPAAREAIVVNAPPRIARRVANPLRRVFDPPGRPVLARLLTAIRARQWIKNVLVFLPVLLAHRLEPEPLGKAALAFLSFGLAASAIYVLNDLLDLDADRHHVRKKARPFASGDLPLQAGFVLVPLLAALSLAVTPLLPVGFLFVLLLYFVLTTLYSLVLKQWAIVDILILAALYAMRIIAGGAASEVPVSEWLLAFSAFIFLSLAAVKRYGELRRLRAAGSPENRLAGRGYYSGDLELIVQMGISSGYIAVLVLALYISSAAVTHLYARPTTLWLVCPLMLYWISRIWLLVHRGEIQDDPLNFAVWDRTTWVIALLSAGIVVLASKGP